MNDQSDNVVNIGHNGGIRPEQIQDYVDRIERVMDKLESERGTYMQACRVLRDDIKEIVTEAADAGIPKKALRAVVKTRELEAKAERLRDDLEEEAQQSYDEIRLALGDLEDTPLGRATLARHPDAPHSA